MSGRLPARFRRLLARQAELAERQDLLNRPWEEDFLHWGADGTLHGHLTPPRGRRRSTTRRGWCPGPPAAAGEDHSIGVR